MARNIPQMTLPTWLGRVDVFLATISSAVLAFMMVFICLGVVQRYVFNAPFAGTNEVLEMCSVAFVMLAIGYCTRTDAHIRVDLIDRFLGPKGIAFTNSLYHVLGLVVLWFLTNSTIKRMMDAREFDDATNMLELPLWPFYGVVAVGMSVYALILVLKLVGTLSGRGRADD